MKRTLIVLIVLTVLMVPMFAGGASEKGNESKPITLKYDLTVSLQHPWGDVANQFKNTLETKSGGLFKVELYPSSTSGSEADSLAGMLVGTTSMTMSGGSFAGYAKSATLLEAPWAFDSEADVQRMVESEIGQSIIKDFEKAGFHVMWYQLRAARQLTSNVPILTPADLKGRKMRMSGNPLHTNMWNRAGAVCSSLALSETFNALSQGVVEMQENPYDFIYDNSFYEVQKYANETSHVYSVIFNIISSKLYNSLDANQKAILDATTLEMQDYANKSYYAHKDDYKQKLIDKGMKINSNVDREAFKKAMLPVIKEYLIAQGDGLWEMYQKIEQMSADN